MTVVQIVGVTIVRYGQVPATGAMAMGVLIVCITTHQQSPKGNQN
jgi:hypothetical protein